ncbi:hypothetical protein PR048_007256 [Dryococelus australis]|uniref:Uncharacterized protein n=1 Tax=Dryococelus australis TaxID=614101 RepID=A0ABQ9IDN6_9NEOP|nr:hypothetical protein PR048_007256 [Dryococelus australis]
MVQNDRAGRFPDILGDSHQSVALVDVLVRTELCRGSGIGKLPDVIGNLHFRPPHLQLPDWIDRAGSFSPPPLLAPIQCAFQDGGWKRKFCSKIEDRIDRAGVLTAISLQFILLQAELLPLLEDIPLAHDGAPPHFHRTLVEHSNAHFPERWIGRGGFHPLPPQYPYLSPLDYCVWGWMMNIVYQRTAQTREELLARIMHATTESKDNCVQAATLEELNCRWFTLDREGTNDWEQQPRSAENKRKLGQFNGVKEGAEEENSFAAQHSLHDPSLEGGSRAVLLDLAPGSQPSAVLRHDASVVRQQPRVLARRRCARELEGGGGGCALAAPLYMREMREAVSTTLSPSFRKAAVPAAACRLRLEQNRADLTVGVVLHLKKKFWARNPSCCAAVAQLRPGAYVRAMTTPHRCGTANTFHEGLAYMYQCTRSRGAAALWYRTSTEYPPSVQFSPLFSIGTRRSAPLRHRKCELGEAHRCGTANAFHEGLAYMYQCTRSRGAAALWYRTSTENPPSVQFSPLFSTGTRRSALLGQRRLAAIFDLAARATPLNEDHRASGPGSTPACSHRRGDTPGPIAHVNTIAGANTCELRAWNLEAGMTLDGRSKMHYILVKKYLQMESVESQLSVGAADKIAHTAFRTHVKVVTCWCTSFRSVSDKVHDYDASSEPVSRYYPKRVYRNILSFSKDVNKDDREISDIDLRDILCWKTYPVHEGKSDQTAVISVFGNASKFSSKKMKLDLGDNIWLYRKLVGTTGDMHILGHVELYFNP